MITSRAIFILALALLCGPVLSQAAEQGPRPWTDYRAIMWVGDTAFKKPEKLPLFFERLREMGINTGMVHGQGSSQALLDARFPYYVENMVSRGLCLKWNSNVKDWDKVVTDWAAQGRPDTALVRDYCLDDPQWQESAQGQMKTLALAHRTNSPLAYDIRDELSTTISANPFDYDFNPIALAGFRDWLKTHYPNLASLNAQWDTAFESWDKVRPFTTDQIKERMATGAAHPSGKPDWSEVQRIRFSPENARKSPARWNFSPWADFRTYMDLSLARALSGIRQASRSVDPATPVGIEGTQMPHAFGGYDLWRLSRALDWVEPYDIGNAREIFGSFMDSKTLLTTVFETTTDAARRRLWHLLLEGDRGCIIWWSEDCIDWSDPQYRLTAKGRALAPVLKEMTSPLARLFLSARREYDPILIHYSQASIQMDWLLESTVDGSTWLRRFSSFESEHNRQAKARNGWLKLFQDLGYSPRFISSAQIESGQLESSNARALVMPSSWALSDGETQAVQEFVGSRNGSVFFDGTPGQFDAHGKLRPQSPLAADMQDSGQRVVRLRKDGHNLLPDENIARYGASRLGRNPTGPLLTWAAAQLSELSQEVSVPAEARVRVRRFAAGPTRLLAFERNIDYHMSEDLKQAGGNEALEKPIEVTARLSKPRHIYDLRASRYLGETSQLTFRLDPWQPSLFAVSEAKLPEREWVAELLKKAEEAGK